MTDEIYTEIAYELAQKDYSSESTKTMTTAVQVNSNAEAEAHIELNNGAQQGQEWPVTYVEKETYIQYYDLYKEYFKKYQVIVRKDSTTGRIVEKVNKGMLQSKTYISEELQEEDLHIIN